MELFEKNERIGGKLNIYETEGFSFDLGPSILTLPGIFRDLFQRADRSLRNYVELKELDLQWRSLFEDGTVIDLYSDLDDTLQKNEVVTGDHIENIREFLSYSHGLWNVAEEGYFSEGLDTFWDFVFHYGLFAFFRFDYFSTVNDGVTRYIDDPRLQDIFNFFIKYVGSSPYDAPAVMNLLPHVQQEYGLWYVNGGLYNLAEGLRELLDDVGVELHLNSEVHRLTTDGEAVTGIELSDDRRTTADVVVSNMEVIPTYDRLVEQDVPFLDDYREKFEPSCSGLVMHLGVDRTYDILAHHNFFFSEDPRAHFDAVFHDYELPADPTVYVVAPAKTDPELAPDGCENLKILPHIPHIRDGGFSVEEYDQFEDRLLSKLERMGLENLRDHVIVEQTLYPSDIQQMYYSHRGSIYGVVSDRQKNNALKAPKKSELLDNLFFTGGSVNPGAGMPMVTLCGQLVADEIMENFS